MGYTLQETDTAAVDGSIAACSALTADVAIDNRQATNGGTVGTVTPTITCNTSGTTHRDIHFESAAGEMNTLSCPAGNWTVRVNVTTGNAQVTWLSCHICRVNSSGVSQQTIGSNTSLSITMNTGVQSVVISGVSAAFATGDRIYIVVGLAGPGGSQQSIVYKPDQLIDTPLLKPDPRMWSSSGSVNVFEVNNQPLAA